MQERNDEIDEGKRMLKIMRWALEAGPLFPSIKHDCDPPNTDNDVKEEGEGPRGKLEAQR